MPKQLSRKRAASEEYEADGGFVEDAPKNKKSKAASEAKGKASTKSDESSSQYWEVGGPAALQCGTNLTWQTAWTHAPHSAQ